MANIEESDVAAECEYRKEKGVAKWHEKFLVEYRGGRKTEGRNYLQNRLSPENHSRNVFLNKNKRFLK